MPHAHLFKRARLSMDTAAKCHMHAASHSLFPFLCVFSSSSAVYRHNESATMPFAPNVFTTLNVIKPLSGLGGFINFILPLFELTFVRSPYRSCLQHKVPWPPCSLALAPIFCPYCSLQSRGLSLSRQSHRLRLRLQFFEA